MRGITFLCAAFLLNTAVFAEEAEQTLPTWNGEGELGYVAARGNTETETVSGKLKFSYKTEQWLHELGFSALRSKADDAVTGEQEETADRFQALFQSNWKINLNSYLFGAGRYEEDQFSGYDNQNSLTFGYGYTFVDSDDLKFKIEAGAGARHSEFDTGEEVDETIFRFRANHAWKLTENTRWTNEWLIESGEDNTYSEFATGLKVDMTNRFALKLAYLIRENSTVPLDREKRDTLTTINLVFAF